MTVASSPRPRSRWSWPRPTPSPSAWPARRSGRGASPCELSRDHEVKLISISRADITNDQFEVLQVPQGRRLAALVEWCDVFVFQGWVMAGQACFERPDRIFVVDVYDPMHLEQLEQGRDVDEDGRWRHVIDATAVLNHQLARGDFFLCASEKQRDLWMGAPGLARPGQPRHLRRRSRTRRAHRRGALRHLRRATDANPRRHQGGAARCRHRRHGRSCGAAGSTTGSTRSR